VRLAAVAAAVTGGAAVLVSVGASSSTAPPFSPAATAAARCAPVGEKVRTQTSALDVYRARQEDNRLYACNRETRERYLMDDPPADVYAFPSIAARGKLLAFAVNRATEGDIETTIRLADASRFGSSDPMEALVRYEFADVEVESRVGQIVLSRGGGLAWTTCPAQPSSAQATLRPNCRAPGGRDRVWRWPQGERRPRSIARGRGIAPQSLRLSGTRLSWLEGGRRVAATLP
jgi:hypothetical protein